MKASFRTDATVWQFRATEWRAQLSDRDQTLVPSFSIIHMGGSFSVNRFRTKKSESET